MTISLSIPDDCDPCVSAYNKIQEQYAVLADCRVNKLLDHLFANSVITLDDKREMESKPLEKNRMTYLLDEVLISLRTGSGLKYNKFLEVLQDSDDYTFTELAKNLGQYNLYFKNFHAIAYIIVTL